MFGIAMGGIWGQAANTALENVPPQARGLISGFLQQGECTQYFVSSVFSYICLLDNRIRRWISYCSRSQSSSRSSHKAQLASSVLGWNRIISICCALPSVSSGVQSIHQGQGRIRNAGESQRSWQDQGFLEGDQAHVESSVEASDLGGSKSSFTGFDISHRADHQILSYRKALMMLFNFLSHGS